jgi:hypothetical protein
VSVCGIDYSSRAVDIVLLDEDTDAATWHRIGLDGADSFERARDVMYLNSLLPSGYSFWDSVIAIGIEDPRGYGSGSLYRIQGAILTRLPRRVLVHPWIPSAWRKAVGLPGNAPKKMVEFFVHTDPMQDRWDWPQDACDAFCIALATRSAIQVGEPA